MRVLLTTPSLVPSFGGPAGKAASLAAALRRLGHGVTVIGCGDRSADGVIALTPLARFHGTPIPWAIHRIARAVRRADVLHVTGYRDPVGTVAALVARIAGVPYVLEPVGMHRRRLRSRRLKAAYDAVIGRTIVRRARLVIATSRVEATELAEDGVRPERIAVRANGLSVEATEHLPPRGAFRSRLHLDSTTPLVLSLGRIVTKKGLPLLVDALARFPGAHLAIVGPDDGDGTIEAVEQAVERFGVAERVHLLKGGLWGNEKLQALVDADLFCLFSMTENFGVAPAEAAACGTATIVSAQCGVAEWLGDGVAVVPYGDVAALSATIARLLRDPGQRRSLAERGRVAARALTWDAAARRQSELLQYALENQ